MHDPVLACTSELDEAPSAELAELAAALRACVPVGGEDGLPPRVRVFVRLLRRDAIEPAWTLAQENAGGMLTQRVGFSTSSGALRTSVRLPITTVIEQSRVYAWLPGFRDPRWAVPDDVYDVGVDVAVHSLLEGVRAQEGGFELYGWGHLSLLTARADDIVNVVLRGTGRAEIAVPAQRLRRPDLVKGVGEDLARLAWSGWCATIDLSKVPVGTWRVGLAISQRSLARVAPLGRRRGPLAAPPLLPGPTEVGRHFARLGSDRDRTVTLRLQPLGSVARLVPRPVRRAARRISRREPRR